MNLSPVYEASPDSSHWDKCSVCHRSPRSRPCSCPSSPGNPADTERGGVNLIRSICLTACKNMKHEAAVASYSTYFPEDGIDVLPQWMIILDGLADFSHLLQQSRRHSEHSDPQRVKLSSLPVSDAHLHDVLQVLLCVGLLRHQLGRLEVRLDE